MVALRAAIDAAPPSAFLNAILSLPATLNNPLAAVVLVRAKKLPSAVVTVVLVASAF